MDDIRRMRMCLTPWNLIRLTLLAEHDDATADSLIEQAKREEALQLDHDADLTTGVAASIRRDLDALNDLQELGTFKGKELLDVLKLRAALRKELVDIYMPGPKYTGKDAAGSAFVDLAADYGDGA